MRAIRYYGGDFVEPGTYLGLSSWGVISIDSRGEFLPGERTERYLGVPSPLLMVAGPLLGLGYVVLLPIVGFPVIAYHLVRRIGRAILSLRQ